METLKPNFQRGLKGIPHNIRTWGHIIRVNWNILYRSDYDRHVDPKDYHLFMDNLGGGREEGRFFTKILTGLVPTEGGEKQVLDIAAGTGSVALSLSEAGYQVTAFDLSEKALDFLKTQDVNDTITVIKGDMNRPIELQDESFHAIITKSANRFITPVPPFLSEVKRLLKPGGYFVWPIDSGDGDYWKLKNGIFQPTKAPGLARQVRAQGFSEVYILDTKKEGSDTRRRVASTLNRYVIVAKK